MVSIGDEGVVCFLHDECKTLLKYKICTCSHVLVITLFHKDSQPT